LAVPDAIIKMILNNPREEERKKVKENDAKQTEAYEVQVILNGLITTSKKRAYKQVGDSRGTKDSTGVPASALKHSASSFWTETPSLQVMHKDGKNMIDKVLEVS